MSDVIIHNITKSYQNDDSQTSVDVLRDFSYEIPNNNVVCFFGPNGCGKSTLLSIAAGLEIPDRGNVLIGGMSPTSATIAMVFQNYNESMLPWRTVSGNVELAMEKMAMNSSERRRRSLELLNIVGLKSAADRNFYELSGGMKQLTALCRAFAQNPEVLLLDEPFSALDYEATRLMERYIQAMRDVDAVTTLCISHDVDNAVMIADRVVVLSHRPMTIKGVVEVTLPRPRNSGMMITPEFFALRSQIIEIFREQHNATA